MKLKGKTSTHMCLHISIQQRPTDLGQVKQRSRLYSFEKLMIC